MTLLIDNDVTDRVLEMVDAVSAVEDAFTQLGNGDATFQRRTDVWSPTAATGDYFRWAAQFGGLLDPPRIALRIKSDVLDFREVDGNVTEEWYNGEPGTFMGFIFLFDTTDGALIGLLNDGIIQHVRTGSLAGVACKYLAREDATSVGMLGSGGMAETFAEAFNVVRDVEELTVYSPTEAHREAYAEEMAERLDVEAAAVESPEEAVAGADIVSTCTDARQPIYDHEWIEPGQFIVNTSHAEVDDGTFTEADQVFTGTNQAVFDKSIKYTSEERHEQLPYGFEKQDRLYDDTDYPLLSDILTSEGVGRQSDDEAIFYLNRSAAGVPFSAISSLVYDAAVDRGLGTPLPLEWFQQDIRN